MEFFKIGLNYIDEEKITSILDENKTCPLFFLGNEIADKDGFYRDIRDNFPLDPPLLGNSVNWDALADSLWGGIFNLEKSNVFFVWRGHKKCRKMTEKLLSGHRSSNVDRKYIKRTKIYLGQARRSFHFNFKLTKPTNFAKLAVLAVGNPKFLLNVQALTSA